MKIDKEGVMADCVGHLKTTDGVVYLRKSIPETFDIALMMLEAEENRIIKERCGSLTIAHIINEEPIADKEH